MRSLFLRFNLLVVLALLTIQFGINPILEKYACKILDDKLDVYFVNLLKGPYFVTMKYLESVPEKDIPHTIKSLQKEFGFQINAEQLDELDLGINNMKKLRNGEIVIEDDWSVFLQRIGETGWVIRMGPLKDFDEVFNLWQYELLVWGTLICFVALLSLMWAFPFWRNLKNVMDSADYFGAGKFDTRAEVGKRSPLKPMAETFNNMADKIGDLIKSHKLLVNAVSHELRTPISRVRFGIEMLETSKDPEDIKKYTSGISEDIDDLESLVSELLTYAVFDQQSEFLHFEQINTLEWLNYIVSRLSPISKDKKIELDLLDAPVFINADSKFMGRALENIVLNGIRYAESKVVIKVEKRDVNTIISIKDDGPGIPKKDLERIFEPFVRLDESRSRETGGYGLGLAIVNQIMARHGGKAFAKKRDDGACVILTWPS